MEKELLNVLINVQCCTLLLMILLAKMQFKKRIKR